MKTFLIRILFFVFLLVVLFITGMLLPATPKASNYYLFGNIPKDKMTKETKSPRIIFLGGSNLVFGLNSCLIKDSLNLEPINAGTSASVGIIYMMQNSLKYIKPGDIVILAPEYQHYFGKFAYGGEDLVRLVFDVDIKKSYDLNYKQLFNLARKVPTYAISKFDLNEYFNYSLNEAYTKDIFNEYGDSEKHWSLLRKTIKPNREIVEGFNESVLMEMERFNELIESKGARLIVTFPCFQEISFDINETKINQINKRLNKSGLVILGSPIDYKMPDSLMFDTPYHLNYEGVNLRTQTLIKQLKRKL